MNSKFILFLFSFLFIISCEKENKNDEPQIEKPSFNVKIDGSLWEATSFYFDDKSNEIPFIKATDGVYTIFWEFEGILNKGKYVVGENETLIITSFARSIPLPVVDYYIEDGELEITEFDVDKKQIKGNFHFNAKLDGNESSMTEGKFFINEFK